jgi:hypothetical protein
MNDTVLRELKIAVERAVRPVRATIARKCRMREELLAHLGAIFEEEAAKVSDEQAALDQAKRRFGDPSELSGQLQESVSRWERFRVMSERLDPKPGESLWRPAMRLSLFMLAGYAIAMAAAVPVMIARGRASEVPTALRIVLVVGLVSAALSVAFILLAHGMRRVLYGRESERSLRTAAIYVLAALGFFPSLAFVTYWALTGDLAASLSHLRFACWFAPAAPVVFVLMARQVAIEWNGREEWEELEINA